MSTNLDNIKKWYDGYHFGDFDVYCHWDVMCYLADLQKKPNAKPGSYWRNTSDNAIIRSFIDYAGASITKKLEILTESRKSPASVAKSNKQWVGTCLYQEECKLILINCEAVYSVMSK